MKKKRRTPTQEVAPAPAETVVENPPAEEPPAAPEAAEAPPKSDPYRWLMWALLIIMAVQVGWLMLSLRGKGTAKKAPLVTNAPGPAGKNPPPGKSAPPKMPAAEQKSPPPGPLAQNPAGANPPPGGMSPGGMSPPSPPPAPKAPGKPPPPPAPRNLQQLVAGLILMENSSTALSAKQKTQVLDIARRYEGSARRLGNSASSILTMLDDKQREAIVQPHPPPQIDASEFAPGRDPMIERAVGLLEKKAAPSAPAPAPASRNGKEYSANRWMVLTGLLYLESGENALSPVQARQVLGALTAMRKELKTQVALEEALNGALTAAQKRVLSDRPLYEEAVVPGLVVRWLEKK